MTPLEQSVFLERVRRLKCEVARARKAVSEQNLVNERAAEQDCRLAQVQNDLRLRQRLGAALARFSDQSLHAPVLHQMLSEFDCMSAHWQGRIKVSTARRMDAERIVRQGLIAEQLAERGRIKASHMRDREQASEDLERSWREELIEEDYLIGAGAQKSCLKR